MNFVKCLFCKIRGSDTARPELEFRRESLLSPIGRHGSVDSGKRSVKRSVHRLSLVVEELDWGVSIASFDSIDRLSLRESSSVTL